MSIKFSFEGINQINKETASFGPEFLERKQEQFNETINDERFGFFHVTERKELIEETRKVFENFKNKKAMVHVGIGGSSLGPEMLISALGNGEKRIEFINNVDPERIEEQLKDIIPSETLFYFVSKSGGTAETMASLAIIMNLLKEKGISEDQFKDHFVFATDPVKSDLLDLGKKWDVSCLEVPSNVGGRFSVLTPVGYLPALFCGINPEELCEGAEDMKQMLKTTALNENPLYLAASYLYELKLQRGISQTVLMPYSSKLRDLSFWFVQLWAESLGKKHNLSDEVVHTGFTPVPGYGATDQHSQVQLFMEGPKDKCLFMLQVENFKTDYSLENTKDSKSLEKLAPYKLSQLFHAEFFGTLKALEEADRPYIHVAIDKVNERSIGSLILFYESLTALMGHYLHINPFDQPGVEAGKRYAFEWLAK